MRVKPLEDQDGKIHCHAFNCPACGTMHAPDQRWAFNGDMDRPTFSPSLRVKWKKPIENDQYVDVVCHSFIRDGRIEFCSDSTHHMAGMTVDIPEWEEAI